MKNLLFFSMVTGFLMGVHAQEVQCVQSSIFLQNQSTAKVENLQVIPQNAGSSRSDVPRRTQKSNIYTYFDNIPSTRYAYDVLGQSVCTWGQSPYSTFYTLFPDSLAILYREDNNLSNPNNTNVDYLAGIGFTFDPYSRAYDSLFTQPLFPNNNGGLMCGYRIDTLTVYGDYYMADYDPYSPDTLRIFITAHDAYNSDDPLLQNEYFRLTWTSSSIRFVTPIVQYDNINNIPQKGSVVMPVANNLSVIDYILSPQDSIEWQTGLIDSRLMKIPANYEVPAGYVTSIVMKFIPGYDYTNGDTIQKIYYNSSTQTITGMEIRKNVFSASVISDTSRFELFCDLGGGYNSRLAENMNIRYNLNNFFEYPSFNPNNYQAYNPGYYAIPYVLMDISTGDDWRDNISDINMQTAVKVYPNPASTRLHVKLADNETADYTIYSIIGQAIMQGKLQGNAVINIEPLAKGMYYLKVENRTVKFVRE